MAAKNNWKAFEGVVCERSRRLAAKYDRWTAQREKAFEHRDAADAALNEVGAGESRKRTDLLADWAEAQRRIKDLDAKLKDAVKSLVETARYGDQAELFDDPDTFNAPDQDGDHEDGDDGDEKDTQLKLPKRPVGTRNGKHEPAEAGA